MEGRPYRITIGIYRFVYQTARDNPTKVRVDFILKFTLIRRLKTANSPLYQTSLVSFKENWQFIPNYTYKGQFSYQTSRGF